MPRMTITSGLRFLLEINLNVPPFFSFLFREYVTFPEAAPRLSRTLFTEEGAKGGQAILCHFSVYSHL